MAGCNRSRVKILRTRNKVGYIAAKQCCNTVQYALFHRYNPPFVEHCRIESIQYSSVDAQPDRVELFLDNEDFAQVCPAVHRAELYALTFFQEEDFESYFPETPTKSLTIDVSFAVDLQINN